MKITLVLLGAALTTFGSFAETLPYISIHPQSTVVAPGSNVTFTVVSTNATAYQWRFNGTDLAWGTASSLVVTNAQTNSAGYYLAIARNEIGWRPSQLAYLSVVTPGQGGVVPFSNLGNSNSPAHYHESALGYDSWRPITNGTARLYAGPQLDQMVLVGDPLFNFDTLPVNNGFFSSSGKRVPNVAPGQVAWFRVDITYPLSFGGNFTQQSTIVTQITGTSGYPPTATNPIGFPTYPEWPDPRFISPPLSTNQTLSPGESPNIVVGPMSAADWITGSYVPRTRAQWRKDGMLIPWATNHSLTITSFQAADVGVYDCQAFADDYGGAAQSRKYHLSIQTTNGGGRFRFARQSGPDFVCDFEGIANRRYLMQCSTNLQDWTDLQTLTATNGTASFTNFIGSDSQRFYRSVLLP